MKIITSWMTLRCLVGGLVWMAGANAATVYGHDWAGGCQAEPATCRCGAACRVVCEMKTVKKTVWAVECEQFCVPMPRCEFGCGWHEDCDGRAACGGACAGHHKPLVPPRCGKVRTRKKLVKKKISCEVPSYRCIVCGGCCAGPAVGCGSAADKLQTPSPAATANAEPASGHAWMGQTIMPASAGRLASSRRGKGSSAWSGMRSAK